MSNLRIIFMLFFICVFFKANSQLSTNEKPISFGLSMELQRKNVQRIVMPSLDKKNVEAEDTEYDLLFRFGYPHKVKLDLTNSGTWETLPNGDKLWQLNIVCPNAQSVNLCYDKFWIPKGGKFFIYTKNKSHFLGAYTSKNNKGDRNDIRGFATELVYGDDIILEYYQPKEVIDDAIISIGYVVHGYRDVDMVKKDFGASGSCMVNVNCEEGLNWQNEKKAVARVIMQGYSYSGSLITTTSLGGEPLFLTASHCIECVGKDAIGDSILDNCVFYWNYETPGCVYSYPVSTYTTSGATVVANYYDSDFALFRLSEDPRGLSDFPLFYLGWDRSGQSGEPGVCIHHPKNDVKKISTIMSQPITAYEDFWTVKWASTLNGHGVTEPGSSGSALLNAAHRVIGQLYGGNSSCKHLTGGSIFGKFDISWTGSGNDTIQRRLNCWLDPLNTGAQAMEGLLVVPLEYSLNTDQQLYCNILITETGQLTVQSDVESMGESRIIVEAGGKLIVDGGTLSNVNIVLNPGSSIQITNGGIIETRCGFVAPQSVFVDVSHGQIL